MKTETNNNWRLLYTPDVDPYMNMAIDEALTRKCIDSEERPATIRLYTWKETSCSIGYFQKMKAVLKATNNKEIPVVRRPTGGGIVYHGNDITFSIVKKRMQPGKQENITSFYKLIGESLLRGLERLGLTGTSYYPEEESLRSAQEGKPLNNRLPQQSFCSETPAKYDIMINGSKVAGYAARKSQGAVLCQGYLDVYERWEEKYNGSHEKAINLLFDNLAASFKDVFGITLTSSQLTEEEMRSANEIRDKKYACDDWNYRK
ncbi:MAG TPA: biotin/lipoate A/B protein ligase family protein [Candidatus Scalindua sp.]|jgi:lipoate-protein ligase A|nr:biotin/lipoate A/B protein ligase family protein [Candidatus Scalindua sp.]|tara:strand:- start:125 stop:907 length:783 start_codon:yes stop_codon:yes gene_type:complete